MKSTDSKSKIKETIKIIVGFLGFIVIGAIIYNLVSGGDTDKLESIRDNLQETREDLKEQVQQKTQNSVEPLESVTDITTVKEFSGKSNADTKSASFPITTPHWRLTYRYTAGDETYNDIPKGSSLFEITVFTKDDQEVVKATANPGEPDKTDINSGEGEYYLHFLGVNVSEWEVHVQELQ